MANEPEMTLNDYQTLCMRTAGKIEGTHEVLASGAICLAGEAGEFANYVKKVLWHGHAYEREKVVDELGDLMWYIARTARDLDISLDEIGKQNIAKLARRYPEGFSSERSIHREE